MKKTVLILGFILACACCNEIKAQSDGFFNSGLSTFEYRSEEELPKLPPVNQNAPLGSGVLLLSGLGIAYLIRKKIKE